MLIYLRDFPEISLLKLIDRQAQMHMFYPNIF